MERLTKREKFDLGNGEELVLCNYDDSNCNDSCMYVKPCDWMAKAKQKLWDYENAKEQGLLHMAPIPNGTTIYVWQSGENDSWFIHNESYVYGFTEYQYGEFGKNFFVSEEECKLSPQR